MWHQEFEAQKVSRVILELDAADAATKFDVERDYPGGACGPDLRPSALRRAAALDVNIPLVHPVSPSLLSTSVGAVAGNAIVVESPVASPEAFAVAAADAAGGAARQLPRAICLFQLVGAARGVWSVCCLVCCSQVIPPRRVMPRAAPYPAVPVPPPRPARQLAPMTPMPPHV